MEQAKIVAGTRFGERGPLQLDAELAVSCPRIMRSLARDWIGASAVFERFSVQYAIGDPGGDDVRFGGEVTACRESADGAQIVECTLWAETAAGHRVATAACTASVNDDPVDRLPLERLRKAVKLGKPAASFVYRVESNDIDHFAKAIGGTHSEPGVAPPTFFAALDPVERRDIDLDDFLQALPFPKRGGGNAFNEVEYERPIRVGDVLTVTTTYTDIYEKKGSNGTLVFRVRVNEMRDPGGALVATSRCGHVLGYQLPEKETP